MNKRIILNSKEIENAIVRLSHEIVEKNNTLDNVCIIGIRSRGDVLAQRIVDKINSISNNIIKFGYIVQISSGIVPLRLLSCRYKYCIVVRLLMLLGMLPVN